MGGGRGGERGGGGGGSEIVATALEDVETGRCRRIDHVNYRYQMSGKRWELRL